MLLNSTLPENYFCLACWPIKQILGYFKNEPIFSKTKI